MRKWALLLILFAIPLVAQPQDVKQAEIDSLKVELEETQARLDSLIKTNNPIDLGERLTQAYETGTRNATTIVTVISIIVGVIAVLSGVLSGIIGVKGLGQATKASYMLKEAERWKDEIRNSAREADAYLHTIKSTADEVSELKMKFDKLDKKVSSVDHMSRGYHFLNEGKNLEALEAFENALKEDPDNARAHNQIGAIYARQKKYAKAEEAYKKAINIDDSQAVFFLNLGLALKEQRKYPESKDAFEKALERQPVYPQVNYHLAQVLTQLGDEDKAFYHLSIASHANIPSPKSRLWEEPLLKPLQEGKSLARFKEITEEEPPEKVEKKPKAKHKPRRRPPEGEGKKKGK